MIVLLLRESIVIEDKRCLLIQMLIQTPPNLLESVVRQNDAKIDARLMQTMMLMAQRIAESGEKKFLYGGRKSGLWHWVGTPPTDQAAPAPLLIAEGYATAASVYEATGYPCAVAFDCGNLIHV
ncbi:MAG: hypothetical protein HC781_21710, partial [Leptolyngbyaceae cyanobacterium CSU_1_4]|nr:hypothetical protein [Leptolyngbyaceae cyanobacterium CSU_1_4]